MKFIIFAGAIFICAACGVKGRPLPPLTPPEIGRGSPENTSGFEELSIPVIPPPSPTPVR